MSDLATDLGIAVHHLLRETSVLPGFRDQFRPHERDHTSVARNINAAFLISLTGARLSHPARGYLASMTGDEQWADIALFYSGALDRIEEELAGPDLAETAAAARELAVTLDTFPDMSTPEILLKYWSFFFPEGAGIPSDRGSAVRDLRKRRAVTINGECNGPVARPDEQILFTSNVLLTLPLTDDVNVPGVHPDIRTALGSAVLEDQIHWYDHPIPIGIENEKNEAVYGLRALDEALRFEIGRNNAPDGAKLTVLLSISTTHHGIQQFARQYLSSELEKAGETRHLDIFAAAEKDVKDLLDTVLLPAAEFYFPGRGTSPLRDVLKVDGEYGRHFSFLKAAAALWQVLVDERVKATFKLDLDQVFPQETLVSETGKSAFEHLCDPLWGSAGTDSDGNEVQLGMLAGALVNESDIDRSLFTPDVKWPSGVTTPDQWVFASAWPQALSTEAEMMTRYGREGMDGRTSCLQRVHVTGGTTGIMVDHLRRHRPFTPGWIGRAEDQAYLLSALFPEEGPALRYVHAGGLIMRHDKEAFAAKALKAARIGKLVGDYVRILTHTSFARALPWNIDRIKKAVDPFTGCFISKIPVTVSCLRMALAAAGMFASGGGEGRREGLDLVRVGSSRLAEAIEAFCDEKAVRVRLKSEREGWDLYYDTLDALENGLAEGDEFAESMRTKARELVEGWRI